MHYAMNEKGLMMPKLANNYILRIYRLSRKKPHSLVGLVEQVGVKEKKAFTNVQELWEILSHGEKREKKGNKGRGMQPPD